VFEKRELGKYLDVRCRNGIEKNAREELHDFALHEEGKMWQA